MFNFELFKGGTTTSQVRNCAILTLQTFLQSWNFISYMEIQITRQDGTVQTRSCPSGLQFQFSAILDGTISAMYNFGLACD